MNLASTHPVRGGSERLWTAWTDFQRDPSGQTMGYEIHRFTVVVKP